MREVELRTGAWYRDRSITLHFPGSWDVAVHWPDTPPPLTDREIAERIESPIGQPPLREIAKGKRRVVLVVDDLTRATPAFRILPFLLGELKSVDIRSEDVRILVAAGTHGSQDSGALRAKIGREAADGCQVIVHRDQKGNRYIGRTSFGTPVYVNREILSSDCVIGIGGVYPQHTTGFGGGSKLALGVLGRTSIRHMHFRHHGVGGTYDIDNDFRRDLDDVARMIRLHTIFTLHVDARLEVVNLLCGDHFAYYRRAAEFSLKRYAAPPPEDADVVISNAYPADISYNFIRKSYKPLLRAMNGATKVMIGSLHDGLGTHGLFQEGSTSRWSSYRTLYNRISVMSPKEIASKVIGRIVGRHGRPAGDRNSTAGSPVRQEGIWLYRPTGADTPLPQIKGLDVTSDWQEILNVIERQHPKKKDIKVRIYPCASLQCIQGASIAPHPRGE